MLARLLDEHGVPPERPGRATPYAALVWAIVGQQISTSAARAIHGRLVARFDGVEPTPEQILADDPEELRAAAGLSRSKTAYLRSLAEHVVSGQLPLDELDALSDDDVVAALTAVKGLGVWSAHIFLLFQLRRPDVLVVGDLAVRRGAQVAFGLTTPPTPAELTALAEPWRPHRSAACLLLWHSLHNVPR